MTIQAKKPFFVSLFPSSLPHHVCLEGLLRPEHFPADGAHLPGQVGGVPVPPAGGAVLEPLAAELAGHPGLRVDVGGVRGQVPEHLPAGDAQARLQVLVVRAHHRAGVRRRRSGTALNREGFQSRDRTISRK